GEDVARRDLPVLHHVAAGGELPPEIGAGHHLEAGVDAVHEQHDHEEPPDRATDVPHTMPRRVPHPTAASVTSAHAHANTSPKRVLKVRTPGQLTSSTCQAVS